MNHADISQLYHIMHTFSFAFHDMIGRLVAGATELETLKQAIWMGLAEIWQAGLCVCFASDVPALVEERDRAVLTAKHATADCQQVQANSAELKQQCATLELHSSITAASPNTRGSMEYIAMSHACRHGVLAEKAAERLQAEGALKQERTSLLGEVAMLKQANGELSARAACLNSALSVAESLAKSRLQQCNEAALRVRML